MKGVIVLAALLLTSSAAQGQRLEQAHFRHRIDESRRTLPVAFVIQAPAACKESVPRFLGQFLAGTLGGAASALAFTRFSEPRDYGDYTRRNDSDGSATFVRLMIASAAIGTTAGVSLAARPACRAVVPAGIGAIVATVPLWLTIQEDEASALLTAAAFIVAPPLQALTATIFQTLAR